MSCEETPPEACDRLTSDRIRYFTGRHMTARDFRDGDDYHRSHRLLHHRALHGWGVVCGLEVRPHWNEACRSDRVVVQCGLALDCCGHELVVEDAVVTPRIPWSKQPEDAEGYVLVLSIHYEETLTEKVPVLYSKDACSSPGLDYGRVQEGYRLSWQWVMNDDLADHGWQAPAAATPKAEKNSDSTRDPCGDEGCCLRARCPKDHGVVLCVIALGETYGADNHLDIAVEAIDTAGRRSVPGAREHLTHIEWMSFPHGGVVRHRDLTHFKVRFDRPIAAAVGGAFGATGVNERTFVAQYGHQREDLDFIEYKEPPYLEADGRTAVFELRDSARHLCGQIVHITLRCDFILDCRGNPVDGNHLRGRLPSGDGVMGGTFESWFRVAHEGQDDESAAQNASSGKKGKEYVNDR